METVESGYIEKGCGICYVGENGEFLPANPHWVPQGMGYALAQAAYNVTAGSTLAAPLVVESQKETIYLRLAKIAAVSDAADPVDLRSVNLKSVGTVDPADATRLVFKDGMGEGIDVVYRAESSGFHQELVIARKDAVSGAVAKGVRFAIYTELYAGTIPLDGIRFGDDEAAAIASTVSPRKSSTDRLMLGRPNDPPAFLFDASPVWDSAADAKGRKATDALRSITVSEKGGFVYVEEIDEGFLDRSTFPVVCDYTVRTGTIYTSEVWQRGGTYLVSNTVTFYGAPAQLTIEPGVTVKINGGQKLCATTGATIVAVGEYGGHITFTKSSDSYCGESTPGSGQPTYCLELSAGAGAGSRVEYCKMSWGATNLLRIGRVLDTTIKNCVFISKTLSGAPVYWECPSQGAVKLANNLFVGDGTGSYAFHVAGSGPQIDVYMFNNTFKNYGYAVALYPSVPLRYVRIWDNYFEQCTYPVVTQSYFSLSVYSNGYYGCANEPGTQIKHLTASPWDITVSGAYYYNDVAGGGALLKRNGFRSALEAGLYADEFTVNRPQYVYTSTQSVADLTIANNRFYTSESDDVSIGYHPPKVDCAIGDGVTITFTNALTINTGAAVALGRTFTNPTMLVTGQLTCTGAPSALDPTKGYNLMSDTTALMAADSYPQIRSPQARNSMYGSLSIQGSETSPGAVVQYTKFAFLRTGLHRSTPTSNSDRIRNNLFFHCYHGLYPANTSGTMHIRNCLAFDCYYGVYRGASTTAVVEVGSCTDVPCAYGGCTFDGCSYGVYSSVGSTDNLQVIDSVFSECSMVGVWTGASSVVEQSNLFWKNTKNRHTSAGDTDLVPDGSFRMDAGLSPWDRAASRERSVWCLDQSTRNLAVDTGSRDVAVYDGADASVYSAAASTTARDCRPDFGRCDLGYHWTGLADDDQDLYPDLWELAYDDVTHLTYDFDSDFFNQELEPWIECWGVECPADSSPAVNPGFRHRPANGPLVGDMHRTQYVQFHSSGTPGGTVVPTSMDVRWGKDSAAFTTGAGAADRLLFGTTPAMGTDVSATDVDSVPYSDNGGDGKTLVKGFLDYLGSNVTYYYAGRSFRSGTGYTVQTGPLSFKTPPALTPGVATPFSMLVFGSTRADDTSSTGTGNHWSGLNVAKSIRSSPRTQYTGYSSFAFAVHLGDSVEFSGNDNGTDYRPQWDKYLFRPFEGVLASLPTIFVPGDNDHGNDESNGGYKQFKNNFCWNQNEVGGQYRMWWYLDYGNCRFVFLDTKTIEGGPDGEPARAWLRTALGWGEGQKTRWNVVFMHIPPCTDTNHPGYPDENDAWGDAWMVRARASYADVFEQMKVDIVFCGHSAAFEAWKYDGTVFNSGVNYVVTGGGGRLPWSYNVNANRAFPAVTQSTPSANHYCTLEMCRGEDGVFGATKATLRVWKLNGEPYVVGTQNSTQEFIMRQ